MSNRSEERRESMGRRLLSILCFVVFSTTAGPVTAQDEPQAPSGTEQVTIYGEGAFVDELVPGDHLIPDGSLVTGRRHGKTSKLITVRSSFRPEILKSIEDL
jgi:hypothetical protein